MVSHLYNNKTSETIGDTLSDVIEQNHQLVDIPLTRRLALHARLATPGTITLWAKAVRLSEVKNDSNYLDGTGRTSIDLTLGYTVL